MKWCSLKVPVPSQFHCTNLVVFSGVPEELVRGRKQHLTEGTLGQVGLLGDGVFLGPALEAPVVSIDVVRSQDGLGQRKKTLGVMKKF